MTPLGEWLNIVANQVFLFAMAGAAFSALMPAQAAGNFGQRPHGRNFVSAVLLRFGSFGQELKKEALHLPHTAHKKNPQKSRAEPRSENAEGRR